MNIFKNFYSELPGDLQKLSKASNIFTNQFCLGQCNISDDVELSNVSEEVIKKNLLSLGTSKAAGIDQIPVKLLKDGAKVVAVPLRNI